MSAPATQIDLNVKRRFDPARCSLDDFRSTDDAMVACLKRARIAARTDLPVLILGESGTGKTSLARAIHNSSQRAAGPFQSFNAATLSESLLDSQLFGHEKGAFTGATHRIRGKFELAHSGTLFIDEIIDLSLSAQAKILRAVEYGEFERLGSEQIQRAEVRLIAATHAPKSYFLDEEVFRKDLYYRLNGLTIYLPPLRQRLRDLPFLLAAEVNLAAQEYGKKIVGLDKEAARVLFSYGWPGNLRELNRVIRGSVASCEGEILSHPEIFMEPELTDSETHSIGQSGSHSQDSVLPSPQEADLRLKTAEKRHIQAVMEKMGGNKSRAAGALGISRSTLDRKLATYRS